MLATQYFYFINIFIYKKNAFYLGKTSLILAAGNGYTNIVRILLQNGADVNKQDIYG